MTIFGVRTPKYRKVTWPPLPEFQAVGRWEAEAFEPYEWRNDYPNPAFVRTTDRDAFWAAKIIMRFTPEELRALVEQGDYSDPEDEEYFLDVLIKRQHKTVRYYLNRLNPIDEFEVAADGLRFANLSERYGFVSPAATYRVRWSVYDNATSTTRPLGNPRDQSATVIPLPTGHGVTEGTDRFLLVEIHSLHEDHPMWNRRVGIYLRPEGSGFSVVGIERESDPPDALI